MKLILLARENCTILGFIIGIRTQSLPVNIKTLLGSDNLT
jgi:hypothetical protein